MDEDEGGEENVACLSQEEVAYTKALLETGELHLTPLIVKNLIHTIEAKDHAIEALTRLAIAEHERR